MATFIDFEHFIIPDEITLGGIGAGFVFSFLVPPLHATQSLTASMRESMLGIAAGAGVIYLILRLGKLLFGRQRLAFPPNTKIVFTETSVRLPDKEIAYGDLFYRRSDMIAMQAHRVELIDRCYKDKPLREENRSGNISQRGPLFFYQTPAFVQFIAVSASK